MMSVAKCNVTHDDFLNAIPDEALDDRLAFVGTSGSGKTYAAGTAVERLLQSGARVVIVDPLDVWWGLRVRSDGKTPAFPIAIFGGEHGDLPLSEHAGALLGETVATTSESCIISLGGMPTKSAERRFMLAFLDKLYRCATGEPFHIIFDEADLWAPQKSSEPQLQSLMEQIVRRGRVKGFIPWLITQRPAVLSKDVLSQADGIIAMKLTARQDRDAVGGWVESTADRSEWKAIDAKLPTMQKGHGVIWIPARAILQGVVFPQKKTFDSSATPKRGEIRRTASLKPIDIGKLKERIAAIEAQQNKPKKAADPTPVRATVVIPDERALKEAEDRGRRLGFEDGKRVGFAEGYRAAQREAQLAVAALTPPSDSNVTAIKRPPPKPSTAPELAEEAPTIGAERKPLAVLARAYPGGLTESQWATLAGLKRTGGTWSTYRSRLKSAGLIEQHGDLWKATELGVAAAGDVPPVAETPEERLAMWKKAVGAAGKLLDVLAGYYPAGLTKRELAEHCGLEPTGGTFSMYLSRLSGNGLIERNGDIIKASDDLFVTIGK